MDIWCEGEHKRTDTRMNSERTDTYMNSERLWHIHKVWTHPNQLGSQCCEWSWMLINMISLIDNHLQRQNSFSSMGSTWVYLSVSPYPAVDGQYRKNSTVFLEIFLSIWALSFFVFTLLVFCLCIIILNFVFYGVCVFLVSFLFF